MRSNDDKDKRIHMKTINIVIQFPLERGLKRISLNPFITRIKTQQENNTIPIEQGLMN